MRKRTFLKIKIKSLAVEARIIRFEEKRWPGESPERLGLHEHRTYDVRREARSAQLAYGFLRGRQYKQLENATRKRIDFRRVSELAYKYGNEKKKDALVDQLKAWAAKEDEKMVA